MDHRLQRINQFLFNFQERLKNATEELQST